jgi:hypothetical protein
VSFSEIDTVCAKEVTVCLDWMLGRRNGQDCRRAMRMSSKVERHVEHLDPSTLNKRGAKRVAYMP